MTRVFEKKVNKLKEKIIMKENAMRHLDEERLKIQYLLDKANQGKHRNRRIVFDMLEMYNISDF